LVVKRFPNVRFFFVGNRNHNHSYCHEIEKKIEALGLQNVIHFTDELPPSRVPALLASMDISVSSSLSEGMSNALLESMSAGKPVVATAVDGNLELVEDGGSGYLVPPRDSQSMADALLKLLLSPELRCKMGQRAKSRVNSKFSTVKMVDEYEDILQRVCMKNYVGRAL
jgi:glycosyltransferase involved in cell wall biosynthesis